MDRPTPILRWGSALLKLEMWRTSRAFDYGGPGVIEASGNAAIAAAQWARVRGVEIAVKPRGLFTHEVRETLKLWGVRVDAQLQPTLQPPDAVGIFAKTLAPELPEPSLVVAAAGDRDAVLGVLSVWPRARGVLLVAADEELPDLPFAADGVPVTREQAAAARRRLAREVGLLAGHAAAAAAVYAFEHGGVALVTSPGEREFSLDRSP